MCSKNLSFKLCMEIILRKSLKKIKKKSLQKTYLKEITIPDFVLYTVKLRHIATHNCKPERGKEKHTHILLVI